MASKTLGGAGGVLPLPEKALGEAMEKGGRKMEGRVSGLSERRSWNIFSSDLYGQEPCFYGESLVLTGEAMSQLGDMRWDSVSVPHL